MESEFIKKRIAWAAGILLVASMGTAAHSGFAEDEASSATLDASAVQESLGTDGSLAVAEIADDPVELPTDGPEPAGADAPVVDQEPPEPALGADGGLEPGIVAGDDSMGLDGPVDVAVLGEGDEPLDAPAQSHDLEQEDVPCVLAVAAAESPFSPTSGANAASVSACDFLTAQQMQEALASPAALSPRGQTTFAKLLLYAEQYIGMPYVWGGKNPYRDGSFDCSGFVSWVMNNVCGAGIDADQENAEMIYRGRCVPVSRDEARPGDLVFFTGTYGGTNHISHVGIYCGKGIMIDAGDPIGYHYIDGIVKEDGSPSDILFGRLNGTTIVNESTIDISTLGHLSVGEQMYTGEPVEPDVHLTVVGAPLAKDVDYTLSCTNNVEVGTATITVEGVGAYRGSLTAQFAIVPGVEIAVDPVVALGSSITVSPQLQGLDPWEYVYNYVWNYEGRWDEWDSVVRNTGAQTTQTSWSFIPSKVGRYELFVDVVDPRTGACYTVGTWIEVVNPLDGVQLESQDVELGETVYLSASGQNIDLDAYTYNFVWCYEGRWDAWDSVVLSTGSATGRSAWEFVPSKPGRYQLFMDVADDRGNVRTVGTWITVREPSWTAAVDVAASFQDGSSTTVVPAIEGADAEGFLYNYVWNYEGRWDEWGSTVRDTGRQTSNASWEFKPSKPGRYQMFVDVVDRMGFCRTVEAWVQVTERPAENWVLTVETGAAAGKEGKPFAVRPVIEGASTSSFTYNYVWAYNGEWDVWGSTVKSTGNPTTADSWNFVPTMPGRYMLAVDATDNRGTTQTATLWIDVERSWTVGAVAPAVVELGSPVTMYADVANGDDETFAYNYVWAYQGQWDEWDSTVKATGEPTAHASESFVPQRLGRYRIFVDATDADGRTQTASCWVTVVPGNRGDVDSAAWTFDEFTGSGSTVAPGQMVAFSAIARGNTEGLTYRYVWERNGWAEWGVLQEPLPGASECTWSPRDLGTYTVYCDVSDTHGVVATKGWTLKVEAPAVTALFASAAATPFPGEGWCAMWVCDAFDGASSVTGFEVPRLEAARDYYNEYCFSSDYSTLVPGMIIAVPISGATGSRYGHIGIYLGEDRVMHSGASVDVATLRDWVDLYSGHGSYLAKWGWMAGIDLRGL